MEVHRDDVVGVGECLVRRLAVAEEGVDRDVVGDLVPDRGRARPHRVLGMVDPGQHLVVDVDRFGGIERLRQRLRHHHRHRLADMARLVGGQQHVRADEDRRRRRRRCSFMSYLVLGSGSCGMAVKAVGEAVRAA